MWRQQKCHHFQILGCFKNDEKAMMLLRRFYYYLCLLNAFCDPNLNQIRLFHVTYRQKKICGDTDVYVATFMATVVFTLDTAVYKVTKLTIRKTMKY
jgi:hypothetical protein